MQDAMIRKQASHHHPGQIVRIIPQIPGVLGKNSVWPLIPRVAAGRCLKFSGITTTSRGCAWVGFSGDRQKNCGPFCSYPSKFPLSFDLSIRRWHYAQRFPNHWVRKLA
jgi:hypothetical protein